MVQVSGFHKRSLRIGATVAAATAILVGAPLTASADGSSFCPSGSICLYSGPNYTGSQWSQRYSPGTYPSGQNITGSMRNNAESVFNNSSGYFCLQDYDGTGRASTIDPGVKRNFTGTAVNSIDRIFHTRTCANGDG